MFHERSHRRLRLLHCFERFFLRSFGQCFDRAAFARDLPVDLPVQRHDLRPLLHAGATSISMDLRLLAVQQFCRLGHVGLSLLTGNLGRSVIKVSAVPDDRHIVEAPAIVFHTQEALLAAFKAGELERDFIAVVVHQGPRACGMPELHKLTPPLAVLQGKGYKVALVTDGRMSGASGKVPAAIHVSPEVLADGPLGKVRTGDVIRLDAVAGTLDALVDVAVWAQRSQIPMTPEQLDTNAHGLGRELFGGMRRHVLTAEEGAITWL